MRYSTQARRNTASPANWGRRSLSGTHSLLGALPLPYGWTLRAKRVPRKSPPSGNGRVMPGVLFLAHHSLGSSTIYEHTHERPELLCGVYLWLNIWLLAHQYDLLPCKRLLLRITTMLLPPRGARLGRRGYGSQPTPQQTRKGLEDGNQPA